MIKGEHKGNASIEWVILTPLMYATFLVLLYFFFMALTFISYNNLSNSIAQELNMRQSGYQIATQNYSTMPDIITYKNDLSGNKMMLASSVVVSPYSNELKCGTFSAIGQYKEQFPIPFAEVKGIEVTSSKPISILSGKAMAGTLITVKINYTSMVFGMEGPMMTAIGYNIIS